MRHINFFLGAQNGVFWVGAKKFMFKKFMCFFGPLIRQARLFKTRYNLGKSDCPIVRFGASSNWQCMYDFLPRGGILQNYHERNGRRIVILSEAYWSHIARCCDTIAAIPQITRYPFREVSTSPKGAIACLVLSFTQADLCDTPFCSISRDNCAIPHKKA